MSNLIKTENLKETNDEINNALTNYTVMAESLKLEGMKALIDSFKEYDEDHNIGDFYNPKLGISKIKKYIEGFEFQKYDEMFKNMKCYVSPEEQAANLLKKAKINSTGNLFFLDLKSCEFLKPSSIPDVPVEYDNLEYEFYQNPDDSQSIIKDNIENDDKPLETFNTKIDNHIHNNKTLTSNNIVIKNDNREEIDENFDGFISFNKNNEIMKDNIPSNCIKNLYDYEKLDKIVVVDKFNKNKILFLDKIKIKFADENDFTPAVTSEIYDETVSIRSRLLINSRFDFLYKVSRIICKFVIAIKKAYLKRKEKLYYGDNEHFLSNGKRMSINNINFLHGVANATGLTNHPNLQSAVQNLNSNTATNQNNIYYKDKLKCIKYFSCLNNEDMATEFNEAKNGNLNKLQSNVNMMIHQGGKSFARKSTINNPKILKHMPSNVTNNLLLSNKHTQNKVVSFATPSNTSNNNEHQSFLRRQSKDLKLKKMFGVGNTIDEVVDIDKLKYYLKKNMNKHSKLEEENRKAIVKEALFDSIKIIKKEENDRTLKTQVFEESDEEKTSILEDDKSSVSATSKNKTDKKSESRKSDNQGRKKNVKSTTNLKQTNEMSSDYNDDKSLLSKEKEDLAKFKRSMANNLNLFFKNDPNLDKTISPTKKIDTVGLKLFIKDSIHKQHNKYNK